MTGYIIYKLPYTIKKGNKYFITYCPLIDVSSQGETENKAIKNLKEALSLFLISCFERGTIDQVMAESGATVAKRIANKLPEGKRYINIPFPIKTDPPQRECRA